MAVLIVGTMPRNFLFAANLRLYPNLPWAVPLTALYIWFFWRYFKGAGPPDSTSEKRRASLRAESLSGRVWAWALVAGGLGIVALVLALQVANRLVLLPPQTLPDLGNVPESTVMALLLMAAPVAGIVEEAAFRGYMQGPIERRHGLVVAILITGTMFAIAHLDFTLILWPYLRCGRRALWHCHIHHRLDPSCRRAAYGRKYLFEFRFMEAWSGRMAGRLRTHEPHMAEWP